MGTKEFADGFKKTLAFRCAPSSRTESRQVAMLNIGLEDTVAYYTVEDFAAGFKKTLAFQTCVFKQDTVAYYTVKEFAAGFKKTLSFQTYVCKPNRGSAEQGLVSRGHLDHYAESWHILHFTRCAGVHGRESHAV